VAVDLLHKKEKVARDMILRFMDKTNGLMELSDSALESLFSDPALQIVGYQEHGQLRGYLLFRFQAGEGGHFLNNDIIVRTFVYETAAF